MEKSPSIPVRVRTVLHNSKFGSKKLFGRKKRERKKKNAYSLAFQVQTASGDTSPPSFNLIVIEMLHVLSLNLARPVVRSAPKKAFAVNKKQNKTNNLYNHATSTYQEKTTKSMCAQLWSRCSGYSLRKLRTAQVDNTVQELQDPQDPAQKSELMKTEK